MAVRRSKSGRWMFLGTALLCMLFGSLLIINGLAERNEWDDYGSRVKVQGTVISSSYDSQDHVHIEYYYHVDGKNYTSDNILCGYSRYWHEDDAKRTVDRFCPGSNVTVRYLPDDPSDAVVNINSLNPKNTSILNVFIGGFFIVLGVAMVALAFHPAIRRYL